MFNGHDNVFDMLMIFLCNYVFRYEKDTFHHNFVASCYLTKPATVVCTSTLRSEDVKFVFLRNVYSGNSL